MRLLLGCTFLLAFGLPDMQAWLEYAFYPTLLGVLIIASLGVPIPEDIPLIAAGVILRTHPGVATWPGTLGVTLVGIMCGDIILYTLGHRWGRDVFKHRSVSWLITPPRLEQLDARFRQYGLGMVFFGRFIVGVRAAMCITAGVTRFPFWKFLCADVAGAVLSIPLFVYLGYAFAGMLPTLMEYLFTFQWIGLLVVALVVGAIVWYEVRKFRRARAASRVEPRPPAQPSDLPPPPMRGNAEAAR